MRKKRNPIAEKLRSLLFKSKVVKSKKLYNRNEEKLYTLKVATKNYDEKD
jgi:hypothetical protein